MQHVYREVKYHSEAESQHRATLVLCLAGAPLNTSLCSHQREGTNYKYILTVLQWIFQVFVLSSNIPFLSRQFFSLTTYVCSEKSVSTYTEELVTFVFKSV